MSLTPSEISRAVSRVLRHEPWLYELELDAEGWVPLDSLVTALRSQGGLWSVVAYRDVERMVEGSSKRRHELVGGRIRALYGHSVPGRLSKELGVPPDLLFHGTMRTRSAAGKRTGTRAATKPATTRTATVKTAARRAVTRTP